VYIYIFLHLSIYLLLILFLWISLNNITIDIHCLRKCGRCVMLAV
jgi:hypothetical protein